MTRDEKALRTAMIAKARWMNTSGLNQGTSGNISARYKNAMLITPSATPYEKMTPEMIAAMPLDGEYGSWKGPLKPSTEWRFHLDIMLSRPDAGAIVHTHSTYATVLAIARKEIPACHYMMAAFGGPTIRCADYARYGTKELSHFALKALEDRNGCILANHGMIALGAKISTRRCGWRSSSRRLPASIICRSRSATQSSSATSRSKKRHAAFRLTACRMRRSLLRRARISSDPRAESCALADFRIPGRGGNRESPVSLLRQTGLARAAQNVRAVGLYPRNGRSSARGATRPPSSDIQAARASHSANVAERLCL